MMKVYYKKFWPLKSFSLDITKELNGKIIEAVLHIESSGVKHKLTLKCPKVPSAPSTTVRDLFNEITIDSVDSFEVNGEQYPPSLRNSDVQWHIGLWENATIKSPIVHCRTIQGLPEDGWITRPSIY